METGLHTRVCLVELHVSVWGARKGDREGARDYAAQAGSDPRMHKLSKDLILSEHLTPGRKLESTARVKEFYRMTVPWSDNGQRAMVAAGAAPLVKRFRELQEEFNNWVDGTFVPNYPDYINEARGLLNGRFRERDYPSQATIRNKFHFSYLTTPLPRVDDDFRQAMGQDMATLMEREIRDQEQRAARECLTEPAERIMKEVRHIIDRLSGYTGAKAGSFRDSMTENLEELINLLPILNVTANPDLDAITSQLKTDLLKFSPAVLRVDEGARAETLAKAEEILAKVDMFI